MEVVAVFSARRIEIRDTEAPSQSFVLEQLLRDVAIACLNLYSSCFKIPEAGHASALVIQFEKWGGK
ncbi:MAG: hypothetical protein LBJ00_12410 [Planctomycetaceae bacterium]|nr:hypothetical protein [Planctomycetaceae bacterium]